MRKYDNINLWSSVSAQGFSFKFKTMSDFGRSSVRNKMSIKLLKNRNNFNSIKSKGTVGWMNMIQPKGLWLCRYSVQL